MRIESSLALPRQVLCLLCVSSCCQLLASSLPSLIDDEQAVGRWGARPPDFLEPQTYGPLYGCTEKRRPIHCEK